MVPEVNREFLRKLAEWKTDGTPCSSVYLDVDGRKYPRKQDYLLRAEELCHRLREQAARSDRDARRSVEQDTIRMIEFLREMDRGPTRGLALFSASGAGLWEDVRVPRPLPDRAAVSDAPHVLPLEALVETYESFCTVIVDREKARIFLARMGQIEEESDVFDDVPGRHDQGGWSQSRYRRHIEEHVGRHLKHVADELLRFFKRKKFDHLIMAGPEEVLSEFERGLHDYLRRRIASRTTLPMTATVDEVLVKSLAVEEAVEVQREREVVERLTAEASAGRQAVTGLDPVLGALNDGRVETLVVPFGLSGRGARCVDCGRLASKGSKCATCGGRLEAVPDVVESAVAAALRQSSRVETLSLTTPADGNHQEIGALLRY